jgi:hypothetical protein
MADVTPSYPELGGFARVRNGCLPTAAASKGDGWRLSGEPPATTVRPSSTRSPEKAASNSPPGSRTGKASTGNPSPCHGSRAVNGARRGARNHRLLVRIRCAKSRTRWRPRPGTRRRGRGAAHCAVRFGVAAAPIRLCRTRASPVAILILALRPAPILPHRFCACGHGKWRQKPACRWLAVTASHRALLKLGYELVGHAADFSQAG